MEKNAMTRIILTMVVSTMLSLSLGGGALAAKPADVVEWSNGFPSGSHYNLNIHGKADGFGCETSSGGGSVFTPEYGEAEIHYLQNKKSDVDSMRVLDSCAGFDGDAARVQLPAGEYQVYARILAKPAKQDSPREVVFYPKLVEACDDSGTENFTRATTCTESFLMGTGVITRNGVYDKESESLERIDPTGGKGKGKSKATDISSLFQWSGWACDQAYDFDGDGAITLADLNGSDLNGDGLVDEADLEAYLEQNCAHFESEWVFNIADLVVSGWEYKNNGSKLLQVRFYPTDSTTFD